MNLTDRRLEGRYMCAQLVTVAWREPSETTAATRTANAILEDISPLGACVQLEEPIALGLPVTLSIDDERFDGEICYSVFREYGQFVGIRFCPGDAWSANRVAPLHLTDPHRIAAPDPGR